MSSKKLKTVMAEIRKVLEKNDLAGLVFLHEPGNGEYLIKVDTSYSAMKPEGDGAFRINTTAIAKDKKQKAIADTANMLHILTHMAATYLMPLIKLSEDMDRLSGAEHGDQKELDTDAREDTGEFYFKGIARADMKQKDDVSSTLLASNVTLEVSKNLEKTKYLDGDEMPTKEGVKPLTLALVSGIYTNIYFAHHKGYWDSAEHLRYAMDKLQELFVENGKLTIGEM